VLSNIPVKLLSPTRFPWLLEDHVPSSPFSWSRNTHPTTVSRKLARRPSEPLSRSFFLYPQRFLRPHGFPFARLLSEATFPLDSPPPPDVRSRLPVSFSSSGRSQSALPAAPEGDLSFWPGILLRSGVDHRSGSIAPLAPCICECIPFFSVRAAPCHPRALAALPSLSPWVISFPPSLAAGRAFLGWCRHGLPFLCVCRISGSRCRSPRQSKTPPLSPGPRANHFLCECFRPRNLTHVQMRPRPFPASIRRGRLPKTARGARRVQGPPRPKREER